MYRCLFLCYFLFLTPQIALHFDWGVEDTLNQSLKLLKAHSLSLKISPSNQKLIMNSLEERSDTSDLHKPGLQP